MSSSSDMEAAAKRFFSYPRFAVAGASTDTSKFGYKILAWYHQHGLPVTPLNPKSPEIKFPSKSYPTAQSISGLSSPAQTSLSVVTPPKVTIQVLREAAAANVPAVWLQPGTFDDESMQFAKENFKAAVGGEGGNGDEGWCVLMDGEDGLQAAGVNWTVQRL